MLRAIGGDFGPLLVEQLNQEVMARTKLAEDADKVMSEEEYQDALAQMRKELPFFLHCLLTHDSGELPDTWNSSQN